MEERAGSDEEDAEIIINQEAAGSHAHRQPPKRSKQAQSKGLLLRASHTEDDVVDDDDPWLTAATGTGKSKKSTTDGDVVLKPAEAFNDARENRPSKASQKSVPVKQGESSATNTEGWVTVPRSTKPTNTEEEKDNDTDASQENPILTEKEKQAMYHARAFAGDEVETAFNDEKALQTVDEDTKLTSTHLPGWGSWAGEGLTKAVRKQNAKQAHNPLYKTRVGQAGTRAADRKDAKLQNVIISEAQQRRSKKYLATQLPHEYERREQYERSLRIPIGPEWTTKDTFQRNTKPRVVVKQGVIKPMEKPLL